MLIKGIWTHCELISIHKWLREYKMVTVTKWKIPMIIKLRNFEYNRYRWQNQVSSDTVHMNTLLSWSRRSIFIKPYVEVWCKQLFIRDQISWPTPFHIMPWISNDFIICSHCCNMGCDYIFDTSLVRVSRRVSRDCNIGIWSQNM